MNFSPYNVLQDQQSLQSGQYLYMLNKISVFQGGKTPLFFKLKCSIFLRKYDDDFEFFACLSNKGLSHPYGVAMANTGYGLAVPIFKFFSVQQLTYATGHKTMYPIKFTST